MRESISRSVRLRDAMIQMLLRVDMLPWNESVARCYVDFCSALEARGINQSDLDMMIAARAVAVNGILVRGDQAFAQVPDRLSLVAW